MAGEILFCRAGVSILKGKPGRKLSRPDCGKFSQLLEGYASWPRDRPPALRLTQITTAMLAKIQAAGA
jgi:hypothetical protein